MVTSTLARLPDPRAVTTSSGTSIPVAVLSPCRIVVRKRMRPSFRRWVVRDRRDPLKSYDFELRNRTDRAPRDVALGPGVELGSATDGQQMTSRSHAPVASG